MCYNIAYIEKRADRVAKHYGADFKNTESQIVYFHVSGFSHPKLYVITQEEPKTIQLFSWGLIPHWCRSEEQALKMADLTLNAVGETVFEKPSFRSSVMKRRCLVIVSGFYEWYSIGKRKFPFYIHSQSKDFFSMGGLYENWVNRETGELRKTFSIITTPANRFMEKIHNSKKRMPLIFNEKQESGWLSNRLTQDEVTVLIQPFADNDLIGYPVSKRITDRTQNSNIPEVMLEFEYPELKGFNPGC